MWSTLGRFVCTGASMPTSLFTQTVVIRPFHALTSISQREPTSIGGQTAPRSGPGTVRPEQKYLPPEGETCST